MISKKLLLLWLVLMPTILFSKALTMRQILILHTVKNIALQHPNSNGKTFEKTAMAICLVETSGGKANFGDKQLLKKNMKDASYGIMQVRLQTARFVAKAFNLESINQMSDIEIITNMMQNNNFSAKMGILYLVWLSDHSKSYFEMVSRYNGGRVNHPYYNKVQKKLNFLKKYKF